MKRAALHNLGCKVNAYETEAMQQLLEEAGYTIVPFSEEADVYIINTCSVTNVADKKSRQMIHRARGKNPDAVVVATGCYVQAAEETLKKDAAVDILIGNNRKQDLVAILARYFEEKENRPVRAKTILTDIPAIGEERACENLSVSAPTARTRAFIKIQDGCDQFCSYCIIPYVRGRVRSRRPGEIEEEVRTLAEKGCREVVLTGIHLSSYGLDFERGGGREGEAPLLTLLKNLQSVEGIARIRLGSLEPRVITPSFAEALAGMDKICPHFHLSLQSGCDATLKRMNRHYTTEEYLEKCDILRRAFSDPAITTDVIVGFPQETEEEFSQTAAFVRRAAFYEMHIFKYSRRAGTKADCMEGQISEEVKTARSEALFALEREMSKEFRSRYLGRNVEVLMETKFTQDGAEYMVGHTGEYVKMAVPYEEGLKNRIIKGKATTFLNDEILLLLPTD